MAEKRVPLKSLRPPGAGPGSGAQQYVADFVEELERIGEVSFAYQYRWPALVVAGITAQLSEQGSKTGTIVTDDASTDVRMASLLIGRVFFLRKGAAAGAPGQVRVGRVAENDVAISEYSISKHHCVIRPSPARTTIEDLGSTNGSFMNGARLEPRQQYVLPEGAELVLGRFAFRYLSPRGFLAYLRQEIADAAGEQLG